MKLGLGVYSAEWIPTEGITHHQVYANDLEQAKLAEYRHRRYLDLLRQQLYAQADPSQSVELAVELNVAEAELHKLEQERVSETDAGAWAKTAQRWGVAC